MSQPDTNDPLDALLREEHEHIDDNGFTARVIAALPQRKTAVGMARCAVRGWRQTLLLSATGIAYALTIRWAAWNLLDWPALLSLNLHALLAYAVLLAIIGSLVWGVTASLGWEE
jgi:uncharacterized membrane protein